MTASQCMQHKWLQRRPPSPPQLNEKLLNNVNSVANLRVPNTASPVPPPIDDENLQMVFKPIELKFFVLLLICYNLEEGIGHHQRQFKELH